MHTPVPLLALLVAVLLSGCQQRDSVSAAQIKEWSVLMENRLRALEDNSGAYTLVTSGTIILKLDTRTGDTWEYRSQALPFPTQDGSIVQHQVTAWWPVGPASVAVDRAEQNAARMSTAPSKPLP